MTGEQKAKWAFIGQAVRYKGALLFQPICRCISIFKCVYPENSAFKQSHVPCKIDLLNNQVNHHISERTAIDYNVDFLLFVS